MKLLIGGSSTFMFHLQEFTKKLNELGVETKLVFDADYADGFPSRNISTWLKKNKKTDGTKNKDVMNDKTIEASRALLD